MHLYTGYKTVYFNQLEDPDKIHNHLKLLQNLVVVEAKNVFGNTVFDPKLTGMILKYRSDYEVLWENEKFVVYKQN